jgi:hypothetical protein
MKRLVGRASVPATGKMVRSAHPTKELFINLKSKGGTGVSPVQAQAEACGYKK